MIDTKFYRLKSQRKKTFFSNVSERAYFGNHTEYLFPLTTAEGDKHIRQYHIMNTTVSVNDYDESENPNTVTITGWAKTRRELEEKVNPVKALLEELGGGELVERDILSGR